MRDILFKAKRLDNGEWVQGWPYMDPMHDHAHITYHLCGHPVHIAVNTETVCQYTGLTDKNGVKIFENDVINVKSSAYSFESVYVEWNQEDSAWCFRCANMDRFRMLDAFSYEVVGNIHDDA